MIPSQFFTNYDILSTLISILYSSFSEFLGIIEGNVSALMDFTTYQIVSLEISWAHSFHGIWGPTIFIISCGAGFIGIYAIFAMAAPAHVMEEAL